MALDIEDRCQRELEGTTGNGAKNVHSLRERMRLDRRGSVGLEGTRVTLLDKIVKVDDLD